LVLFGLDVAFGCLLISSIGLVESGTAESALLPLSGTGPPSIKSGTRSILRFHNNGGDVVSQIIQNDFKKRFYLPVLSLTLENESIPKMKVLIIGAGRWSLHERL
jgi:hypothetical protein